FVLHKGAVKRIGALGRAQREQAGSTKAVCGRPISQPPNQSVGAAQTQMVLEVDVPDTGPVVDSISSHVALVKVCLQRYIRAIQKRTRPASQNIPTIVFDRLGKSSHYRRRLQKNPSRGLSSLNSSVFALNRH